MNYYTTIHTLELIYFVICCLQILAFDQEGREKELPHLQFNENITQFDLTMDTLWSNFSKSRFAIETIMVGDGKANMKIDMTQSIDDEYSPGVFRVIRE